MPQGCAARVSRHRVTVVLAGSLACLAALPLTGAMAQSGGFFDALFGAITGQRPPVVRQAPMRQAPVRQGAALGYSDPSAGPGEPRKVAAGRGGAFCVRLCDGRYFPVTRSASASPASLCNALCPATKTKIYSGSSIDGAVGEDGSRYTDLRTAFTYRERLVPDCTCNGRDSFGLAKIDIASDPTLRAGDVVMTARGPEVFTGSAQARHNSFTPITEHSAVSPDLRRKLTSQRGAPAD